MKGLTAYTIKKIFYKSLFSILLFLFSFNAMATHFRYANISWSRDIVNANKIHFKVTEAWRRGFNWQGYFAGNHLNPVPGDVINFNFNFPLNFGDGAQSNIMLTVTSMSVTDDWIFGEYNVDHTYSFAGGFLAFFEGAARLSGPPMGGLLQNNGDGSFRVETRVTVGNNNDAPVSTLPPVLNMVVGQGAASYQIPATDPDGDPIFFSLAPSTSFTQTSNPPNIQPPLFSVSPTGLILFNTVGKTIGNFYNAVIRITDSKGAYVHLDVLIKITGPSNAPAWDYLITPANNFTYLVTPGTPVNFTVKARDPDPADFVTLFVNGIPIGATMTPGLPFSGPVNAPAQSTFNWTPSLSQTGSFVTTFIAQDPQGVQTPTTVKFTVACNTAFTATHVDADCNNPGSITVDVTSGDGPLQFSKDGGLTFTPGTSPFLFDNLSPGIYKIVVKEGNGCTVTQNEPVGLIPDVTPPAFSGCPSDISMSNATGECGAVVNYTVPTATDQCPGTVTVVQTSGLPSGSSFPVGTTTNSFLATDAAGNTSVCTFTVTVTDNEAPELTCPDNITHTADQGLCSYSFTLPSLAAKDNCPGVSLTGTRSDGLLLSDPYPVGTISIVWKATDAAGNTTSCTQTVTITDDENPQITCPPAYTGSNDPGKCGAQIPVPVPVATDNCRIASVLGVRSDGKPLGDEYPVGTTSIVWTAKDIHGNTSSCTQTITINDTELPVIICGGPVSVSNDPGQCGATIVLTPPQTSDNCGVLSVTNFGATTFPLGITTLSWTVTDIHGNTRSCIQTVTVTDTEKPVLHCPADQLFCRNINNSYNIPPLTATDNCQIGQPGYVITGATSRSGTGFNASGPFNFGTSYITWSVSDFSGNTQTCQTKVVVGSLVSSVIPDAMAMPSGVQPNTVYPGYAPASSITLTIVPSGGTAPYSYLWSNGATTSSITVSPLVPTVYTVTVTDANGCFSTASKLIKVVDVHCVNNNDKVVVCQVPGGNPGNAHTICISANAVPAHISNGSYLGACVPSTVTVAVQPKAKEEVPLAALELKAYPNPSPHTFSLEATSVSKEGQLQLVIYNAVGKVIEAKTMVAGQAITLGASYRPGIYFAQLTQGKQTVRIKIVKQSD